MTKPKNPRYPKQLSEPIRWIAPVRPSQDDFDVVDGTKDAWERTLADARRTLDAEIRSKIAILAQHYRVNEKDLWSLLLRVCEDKFRGFKIRTSKSRVKRGKDHGRLLIDVAFAMRDGDIGERQALEALIKTPRYKPKGLRRSGDKVYGGYNSLQSRLREAEKAEPFVKTLIEAGAWKPWLEAMRDRCATE